MNNKRAALLSGNGAWSAFGGGTLAKVNGDYNTIISVSTGSLIAPLVALKEWETLKIGYTSISTNDIYDICPLKGNPISKTGKVKKIPIILTLITGQKSICTSNALRNTINKIFSEKNFNDLKYQHKEILVGTQNFAQVPSKIHYFSSLDEEYEEFKDWMWCSANFPFYASLVKKSWRDDCGNFHIGLWSDGGLTDLIGMNQLIGKGFKEIDIILHRPRNVDKYEGRKINNLIENITTSINAMRYDIESEYFYERINTLNKEGARVRIFWLPRRLSVNSMVFNQEEMLSWWDEGYNTAFNPERLEIFEPIKKKL